MKTAICTLFEKHYHFGAAVLVNSLCRAGFTGNIYAGFRGPLPPWAESRVKAVRENQWEMEAAPGVRIIFISLQTTAHFTNYKPDFLLQVEALESGESEAVIYCDPDIVLTGSWNFMEEWLSCGVALCEDVNSPLSENHPRRIGWRRFFQPLGFDLRFRGREYANGGLVGLRWEHRKILLTWQSFGIHIAALLGGMDVVGISGGRWIQGRSGFADCFGQPDQDALNAALEACPDIPTSFLDARAMGFRPGQPTLPHALGPAKPWMRRYLREALRGRPPVAVDKAFWNNAEGPIQIFTPGQLSRQRLKVRIGAALGRFVRRA